MSASLFYEFYSKPCDDVAAAAAATTTTDISEFYGVIFFSPKRSQHKNHLPLYFFGKKSKN
jgi:hypothetical protein